MKSRAISFVALGYLLLVFCSCRHEENLSPMDGSVTFSFSQLKQNEGIIDTSRPACVVLCIKGSNGNTIEKVRLSVFDGGEEYVTETIKLQTGNYQIMEFTVFDGRDKIIYSAPQENSQLASDVTESLSFAIKRERARVKLPILPAFNGRLRKLNLDVRLHYPALAHFDSALIVFTNASSTIKYNLTLDNSSYTAAGRVVIPAGEWKISASYFSTKIGDYKSLESIGITDVTITPSGTQLISTNDAIFVKDKSGTVNYKPFHWEEYYRYLLYLGSTVEGFARLPKDPTNPYIEVFTFQSKWTYMFVSRSFYNRSLDESSNYHQGSAAFELYGKNGDTYDRLEKRIIDTTSLKPGVVQVKDKAWNFADGLIIMFDHHGNELSLFYEWDLRASGE